MKLPRLLIAIAAILLTTLAVATLISSTVSAASLANWKPGNIIEDAVFTNSGTMDSASIQTFLNSKVPTCDTYGAKPSEFGGGTRAQWAASRGYAPPFTCLKDFRENGKTSAQIIYDAAQEFSINPQVLIVLLQKEQSLVTDTWPIPGSSQYKTAAGYGCPDTAACDTQYYGLTNQVRWAARMFRAIMNASPTWYTPYIVGSNFIRYSPDINCDGSTVVIQNRATQALYNYTPYQPNQGALNAGWGTASCGAYGNRNFYHYFVDWFGSTQAVNGSIVLASNLTLNKATSALVQNDTITASFNVKNKSNATIKVGGLGICGRMNGEWYDLGFIHNNTLEPNEQKTISFTKKLSTTGNLELFVCSYNDALGGWASNSYPYNDTGTTRLINATVKTNPTLKTSVNFAPDSLYIDTHTKATFSIENTSNQPINLGRMVLAVRDSKQNNMDFPSDSEVIIPAGGTYIFDKTREFKNTGKYTYFLSNRSTGGNWDSKYPSSINSSISREGSFTIKNNPALTSSVSFTPNEPQAGEAVTATITIKNNSAKPVSAGRPVISLRSSSGANLDFPSSELTVPAETEVSYSQTRILPSVGKYTFEVVTKINGEWNYNFPEKHDSSIKTKGSLTINSPVNITYFSLSSSNKTLESKQLNAVLTIKNTSNKPVSVGRIVLVTRNEKGENYDLPSSGDTIIPANESITLNPSRNLPLGKYMIQPVARTITGWEFNSPDSLPSVIRVRTVNL